MDEQVANELLLREIVEHVVDGFLERDLPMAAAAAVLVAQLPTGDTSWETSCHALMTMVLQDLVLSPGQKKKFVDAISKMILNTWHDIDTGKAVMVAVEAIQARGRVVTFSASDNTFKIDGTGPFSFDDVLDEASRL